MRKKLSLWVLEYIAIPVFFGVLFGSFKSIAPTWFDILVFYLIFALVKLVFRAIYDLVNILKER